MNLSLSNYERVPPLDCYQPSGNLLDLADRMLEKFTVEDNNLPQLLDRLQITCESGTTSSGTKDTDYINNVDSSYLSQISQFRLINKIPLPQEISDHFSTLAAGSSGDTTTMGMFPDINRAWMAVESDIYLWNFETGGDVAYFDGLNDPIVSVGLIAPRPGVFQSYISHLLILTTPVEITVLGVILASSSDRKVGDELQLTPDTIYTLSTDGVPIRVIKGTKNGRIFLGGKDGNLYELVYRKEMSWGGKRAWKVNHTKAILSYIVPTFVAGAFSEEDQITEITVDESRNILYTLSIKGSIEVFDLGRNGDTTCRVASLHHSFINRSTVDLIRKSFYFRNITPPDVSRVVSLCPISENDSPHFGVVGVTENGIRLYFTTGSPPRPSTLSLLHARLPPGHAPNTANVRIGRVAMAIHKSGTFIMVSSMGDYSPDRLWCFTMDGLSALKLPLTEFVFTNPQNAAITIAESRENMSLTDRGLHGHFLVYQQNYPQDRFIILSQQGTDIYEKLRPVDIFGELMREKGGPDCEEVKQFFAQHGSDQACAMALILACDQTNQHMAEWATRAFFLYGGDPKYVLQTIQQPIQSPTITNPLQQTIMHHTLPLGFKPGTVSTPLGEKQVQPSRSIETYGVSMSSKHNGLYIFLSRMLRPVWLRRVLDVNYNKKPIYLPTITCEELSLKTVQLYELRSFLARYTLSSSDVGTSLQPANNTTVVSPSGQRTRLQEALIQEKASLDALRNFVERITQVFSLWKLLCDHELPLIVESLSPESQDQLIHITFRELILKGEDLCHELISKLVSLYLNDNASVDPISSKLREVCPLLYKNEDATCTKVNEILQMALDEIDEEAKLNLLRSAIDLCKNVSPNVDIDSVCKSLVKCGYYDGVLEMCQDVASKSDSNLLASKFIARGRPVEDVEGSKAFEARHKAYQQIIHLLDFLYQQCQLGGNNIPPLFGSADLSSHSQKLLEATLEKCLSVEDETCHIVVYDWLVSRELQASLVSLGRPSVERFLSRYPVDNPLRDLLWQYHEKSGNHAAAAQILYKIATAPGEFVTLHQRLTYLGKAVMCMRSDGVGCASHLGVFLHELEDLVHVARVQKQILERITSMPDVSDINVQDACRKLNANLLSITELYESFAEPFGLWEQKLAILDCAGHDDKELINSIWDNIILKELDQCNSRDPSGQMVVLVSKVRSLGLQFGIQSPCFPIEYLVWQLELISCKLGVDKFHVHNIMTSLGVPYSTLLDIYSKMYSANDNCWLESDNEFHLIQVIASFCESFCDNKQLTTSAQERKSTAIQMHDLINECIIVLHSKTGLGELVGYLKSIQTKLERI